MSSAQPSSADRRRFGFSLVETALALLVVGVGLMAVMALLPSAMDANKRSIDETQIGLFGDAVLGSFRSLAEQLDWSEVSAGNPNFRITMPAPGPDMWMKDNTLLPDVVPVAAGSSVPGNLRQAIFKPLANTAIEEVALRYVVFVGTLDNNRKFIELRVWPGAFGALDDGLRFYTELYHYQ